MSQFLPLLANYLLVMAVPFVLALALSLVLPFAVKPLLVRLGIMDVPNERSSHERPVLRGLGLAVLIAIALVEGAFLVSSLVSPGQTSLWVWLTLVVAVGTLCSGLLGLSEDLRGISVLGRSVVLLAIAAGTAVTVIWLNVARNTDLVEGGLFLPDLPIWVLALLAIYGVLFVSSYINVANFMDGLNGISGFHGVIAGLTFAVAGTFVPNGGWLAVLGVILAGAFAGFLPWNLSKPGAFLGDVGSYLLGGAVAITSFAALMTGVPILATIGPMIIYFGDVGVTLVKRVRAGHKWDEPHKEHVYQRLNQLGLSHVQASGINALFTIAASVLGLVSLFVAPIWWILLLVLGLALVVLYVRMPKLLARRA